MFFKSMTFFKAALFCSALIFSSCGEETEIPMEPDSEIVFKKLQHPIYFSYGMPQVIDLDGNAIIDFQFGVTLMANELGDHYQFVVSPSRLNTSLVNELESIPLETNFEIGDNSTQEGLTWDIGLGKLLTKLQRPIGDPSWSGTWNLIPDGIIGVRFFIGDKAHYGWIKVGNDYNSNQMTVLEYAYHAEPGKPITTGQTK